MEHGWLKITLYVFALLTALAILYNLKTNDEIVEVECIQGVIWDGDFTDVKCPQYARGM